MSTAATVTLSTPIRRGEQVIEEVTLRKPMGGDLRGLSIQQIMQGDYNSIRTLVPRIASPQVLDVDIDGLDSADVGAITGEVMGFFMTKAQIAAISQYLGMEASTE